MVFFKILVILWYIYGIFYFCMTGPLYLFVVAYFTVER